MPPTAGPLDPLEEEVVRHVFELYPSYAVSLGRHEYDGRTMPADRASTDTWLAEAEALLSRLRAIPATELSEERRHDRFLLELLLEGPRFDLAEVGELERNPMAYLSSLSLTSYIARPYAPAAVRAEGIIALLRGIPRLLDTATRRLCPVLPRPFVSLAVSMGRGLPASFDEAAAFVAAEAPAASGEFRDARRSAEEALGRFVGWLESDRLPRADEGFALGPARFQRLLWVREGLETPWEEIEATGRADLARNQARLAQIARQEERTIPTLLDEIAADHPTAEELVPTARALVEEARSFVVGHALATVPKEARARVEPTPAWGRSLSTASMDSPGPFEPGEGEGIYYVTPVDPAWTPEQREEWLRSLNRTMLANITVHEVYPGHYLQFLAFRRAPLSLARRAYLSPSFVEGWAHYAEQLAIEEGYGAPSHRAEVAQIHDALLRDCRLLAAIGLHARGWGVAEATSLFQREAHFEALPAQREAIRGTFNPEYFCYTLGKLAILSARDRHLRRTFGGSLRAFHDALLGLGCPPIGRLDALLGGGAMPTGPR
ncbi:MAG: DUF885 domain-containing protein [Thermoplasmata archaeon]